MKAKEDAGQKPLLRIKDLTIAYRHQGETVEVLRDVSFEVKHGQIVGIVGESGSGKTTLALGILGYLPENGQVCQGTISFNGQNLINLSTQHKRELWGTQIGFVPQDALSSLNPSLPVGDQMMEGLLHHSQISKQAARQQVIELLELVQIPDPMRVFKAFPHQLSGGMQQRVMIAMALSLTPSLLVLDEPTTNLDTTTQAAILDLIQDLVQTRETTILYVTHNLGVISQICNRVVVLYAGELIEEGPTSDIYQWPLHPYTRGLMDSVPGIADNKWDNPIRGIQGRIPLPMERPTGCIFLPRCPIAIDLCKEQPSLFMAGDDRRTRCYRWEDIRDQKVEPFQPQLSIPKLHSEHSQHVISLDTVEVQFPSRRSLQDRMKGQTPKAVHAVDGINLSISRGQTLGLVGESGSGKTTLARAILGLVETRQGEIDFLSFALPPLLEQRDLKTLQSIQMVFQNPQESLNPHIPIGETLQRPFKSLLQMDDPEAVVRSQILLEMVQLPSEYLGRFPHQLSGGEIQRVAIARAFATNPKLLVADEPISALDVSVQASILNLLMQLQAENDTAILLISHDITAVGYLSDIVAVMYLGKLMQITQARDLFTPPLHPYTETLFSAIPTFVKQIKFSKLRLEGEATTPSNSDAGCPLHPRCPRKLGEICEREEPPWQELPTGKRIYCHIPSDELLKLQTPDLSVSHLKGKQTQ